MIDHFTISVSDYEASKKFYTTVLAPLGFHPLMEFGTLVGFGDTKPYLWLKQAPAGTTPQHVAFTAKSRAAVDAFHAAALMSGAKDDGAPGVRAEYHPNYYGAFVIDPLNGHPIEAVIHAPAVKATAKKPAPAPAPAKKAVAKKKVSAKKVTAKKAAPKKKPGKKSKR